ncbi:helix-hairpin-helix domain-containing protein [Brevundimonas sp. GCM10030266]|uniref:helix-hairpin-helix domain-containing protein n=1 Tax=Brevundimonas sp. GCM10030266 TaxID=3273386 RepID=UPI003612789D
MARSTLLRARLETRPDTATAEELDRIDGLRGHGFEIVRYREAWGRFTHLRQLSEVPGLAGKTDDAGAHIAVETT